MSEYNKSNKLSLAFQHMYTLNGKSIFFSLGGSGGSFKMYTKFICMESQSEFNMAKDLYMIFDMAFLSIESVRQDRQDHFKYDT
jgi:hypothetical protein